MTPRRWARGALLLVLFSGLFVTAPAAQEKIKAPTKVVAPEKVKAPAKVVPRFDAVAETGLLMEGLALANHRGLEKNLKDKPGDAETWAFVRGQALLIAETGNLLLIRPPRNDGQDAWFRHATELRETAAALAKYAGSRDYDRCRVALLNVSGACNRCHQTFRVPVRLGPGAKDAEPGKTRDTE
jgi:hypothetical protein